MSAGHTPGPWKRDICQVDKSWLKGRLSECVISPQGIVAVTGEGDADARLIAAAPELLDALQAMLAQLRKGPYAFKDSDALRSARAAVAKATGETPC